MTSREMTYDAKTKLNKVDSQAYRNLRQPEIDWALNAGQELFIKMIAFPRYKTRLGFETGQRTTDDIRTLVKTLSADPVVSIVGTLPDDYWHYLGATVLLTKSGCKAAVKANVKIRQHDDEFESSPFHKSSFEWRTVNAVFNEDGLRFYDDGTFTIDTYTMDYVKRPAYIHNAQDFVGGNYNLPSGVNLSGFQNCELPEQTHQEIVDIAVLILTGQIQIPDYQIKLNKLNFNNLN